MSCRASLYRHPAHMRHRALRASAYPPLATHTPTYMNEDVGQGRGGGRCHHRFPLLSRGCQRFLQLRAPMQPRHRWPLHTRAHQEAGLVFRLDETTIAGAHAPLPRAVLASASRALFRDPPVSVPSPPPGPPRTHSDSTDKSTHTKREVSARNHGAGHGHVPPRASSPCAP